MFVQFLVLRDQNLSDIFSMLGEVQTRFQTSVLQGPLLPYVHGAEHQRH